VRWLTSSAVVDVEGARQVVDHQQLWGADEGAGGAGALDLTARQAQAARPDHRARAVGHAGQVLVQACQPQRALEPVA
jgi:hypothetical protein